MYMTSNNTLSTCLHDINKTKNNKPFSVSVSFPLTSERELEAETGGWDEEG